MNENTFVASRQINPLNTVRITANTNHYTNMPLWLMPQSVPISNGQGWARDVKARDRD